MRIQIKNLVLGVSTIILISSCNTSKENDSSFKKTFRISLSQVTLEYKLTGDSLFDDTLKIYHTGKGLPFVYQIWKKGVLISEHAINRKGIWQKLTFVKAEKIKDNGQFDIAVDYVDNNGASYNPYSKEIFRFFDEHKKISTTELSNKDTTIFFIRNVPSANYLLFCNDTTMFFTQTNNGIKCITQKQEGDTVLFYARYFLYGLESKDFWMVVK